MRSHELGKLRDLLDLLRRCPQAAHQRMGLSDAVEDRIGLRDIGSDGADRFLDRDLYSRGRCRVRRRREQHQPVVDGVEVLEHHLDLFASQAFRAVAQRRQRVFDRVRVVCDFSLFDDARRAFERVGEAEQMPDDRNAAFTFLQIENAARKLIQDLARFRAEISVRILGHALRRHVGLNDAHEVLRQHGHLRHGHQCLAGAGFGLDRRLRHAGDCGVDLLDRRRLLFGR